MRAPGRAGRAGQAPAACWPLCHTWGCCHLARRTSAAATGSRPLTRRKGPKHASCKPSQCRNAAQPSASAPNRAVSSANRPAAAARCWRRLAELPTKSLKRRCAPAAARRHQRGIEEAGGHARQAACTSCGAANAHLHRASARSTRRADGLCPRHPPRAARHSLPCCASATTTGRGLARAPAAQPTGQRQP